MNITKHQVTSSVDRTKTYTVTEQISNDGTKSWTCDCPAYTFNKKAGTECKHIQKVKAKGGELPNE